MLMNKQDLLEKKKTYILIFIQKIAAKNIQDLIVFLQRNNFQMKRLTKNYNQKNLVLNITNSNFIIESHCNIQTKQLRDVVSFLKQSTNINGIFFSKPSFKSGKNRKS